ncbi:MAG: hypothetical protein JO090_03655, partial [Rhizobacter sp.]|nr:hypothetical protein [Rhizobacter sp.]
MSSIVRSLRWQAARRRSSSGNHCEPDGLSTHVGRCRRYEPPARSPQRRYDGSAESQSSSVASAMNVVEKVFAAAMVVLCVVLLLRMVLRPRRRARVDASVRKQAAVWRSRVVRAALWPAAQLRARRETREAIRRAKRSAVER